MYQNTKISTSLPARLSDYYETLSARLTYSEDGSLLPPFQRLLPIVPVAMLGCSEVFAGVIVLILEVLIFDIAVGLWCGLIYALAGIAAIVFVIGTDRERHQSSAVLIFQFVAFMFSITEICLHNDVYQRRCVTRADAPARDASHQCQILLLQVAGAGFVLINTLIFALIYLRVTMVVLKQAHGTFNMSKAMNLTC